MTKNGNENKRDTALFYICHPLVLFFCHPLVACPEQCRGKPEYLNKCFSTCSFRIIPRTGHRNAERKKRDPLPEVYPEYSRRAEDDKNKNDNQYKKKPPPLARGRHFYLLVVTSEGRLPDSAGSDNQDNDDDDQDCANGDNSPEQVARNSCRL